MKRTLGSIVRQLVWVCAFLLIGGLAMAQAPEQRWQAMPSNSPGNGPNYQPSTAPPAGNAPAAAQPTGPYQYPPAGGGNAQLPPLDARSVAPARGPQPPADGRSGYLQYPGAQAPEGRGQTPPGQAPQALPAQPNTPQVPFVLSQSEINALENLLADWEKRNKEIHVLESKFFRWRYDAIFGDAKKQPPPEEGNLRFAGPDKAWMRIEAKDAKLSEQWLCDGRAVFQWDYTNKVVTEWIMPPEMQGKGIGDGPLPFVFGIEAQKLKQRYFMRIVTPPNVQNEVWLEAYPKYQRDAANYSKVEVILELVGAGRTLFPFAIQVYAPNGKDRIVYQLQNPKINPRQPILELFGPDPWKPSISFGWSKRTELPSAPAQSQPVDAKRAILQR
jgi:TIGR03009 family protein